MKFKHGFLLGALTGTVYALLTAKKTGPQLQQEIAGLTDGVGQVRESVAQFSQSLTHLSDELNNTLKPAMKDITDRVETFEFETAPRVDAIQKHVENINDAVSNLDAMPTADQREPLPKH